MKSGIYQITNLTNGKVYVGSAVNIARRWADHRSKLAANKHHSAKLQNAWNKYGSGAFEFSVIEVVGDVSLLIEREQFWIEQTGCSGNSGYNVSPTAYSLLGFRHSEEAKEKCRASKIGKARPAHVLEALRLANVGRQISEEHREKLSKAGKGRKQSAETVAAVVRAHTGVKRSNETKQKISEAMRGNQSWLGKTHSEETKARISAAKTGKKLSPEHRAKISAGQKGKPKPRKVSSELGVTFYDLQGRA